MNGFELNLIVDDSRPTLNEPAPLAPPRNANVITSDSENDDEEIDDDEDEPYDDAFQDVEMNLNSRRLRKSLSNKII